MNFNRRTFVGQLTTLGSLSVLSSCGYILYPERRNQSLDSPPKIDPMVVVLDDLLVLMGLIPGIIAFALDVSSGCIYFPDDSSASNRRFRKFHARSRRNRDIESAIQVATGMDIRLDDPNLVYVVESMQINADQMHAQEVDLDSAVSSARVRFLAGPDGEIVGFDVEA